MTKAIDCLVNVGFADEMHPDWMVRVKEDYFKGDDSFFSSPELPELLESMDALGVERAILLTRVGAEEDRAQRFALADWSGAQGAPQLGQYAGWIAGAAPSAEYVRKTWRASMAGSCVSLAQV